MLEKKKDAESYLSQTWVRSRSDLGQISTKSLTSSNQFWHIRNIIFLFENSCSHE